MRPAHLAVLAVATTTAFGHGCLLITPIDDVKESSDASMESGAADSGRVDASGNPSVKDGGSEAVATPTDGSGAADLSVDAALDTSVGPLADGPTPDSLEPLAEVGPQTTPDTSAPEDTSVPSQDTSPPPDTSVPPEDTSPPRDTAPPPEDATPDGTPPDSAYSDVVPILDGFTPGTCGGTTCGTLNATASGCNGNLCTYTCLSGWDDCKKDGQNTDGCETQLGTVQNCGKCGEACLDTQNCGGRIGCLPRPELDSPLPEITGWIDSNGDPFVVKFKSTGLPSGTIHECRATKVRNIQNVKFGPCDGGAGTLPVHNLAPANGLTPEEQNGTYRIEYRYRIGDYTSPTFGNDFYIHHSLDDVKTCTPSFSDQVYFDVARHYAQNNPSTFPLAGWYDQDAGIDASVDKPTLRNPFIRIAFVDVKLSRASTTGYAAWPVAQDKMPNPYVVDDVRSLRHRFVMNAERTMILRTRSFARPYDNDCRDFVSYGGLGKHTRYACQAFVVNRTGQGLCIGVDAPDGGVSKAPIVQFWTISGWQKIRANHDRRCVGVASCNDIPVDGGTADNPFKLYLAP